MHTYGIQKEGTDGPICREAVGIQIQRTDLWIQNKREERAEQMEGAAWKHIYYHV